MNIILHGMENNVVENLARRNEIKIVRYADDFLLFQLKLLKTCKRLKKLLESFFKSIGLKLSEEETRIRHSMKKVTGTEGPPGLDLLGYHFRNVRCSLKGKINLLKLTIHPSKDAVERHKVSLRVILKKYKRAPLGKMIERTAFIIRGWTWYHSVTKCHIKHSQK